MRQVQRFGPVLQLLGGQTEELLALLRVALGEHLRNGAVRDELIVRVLRGQTNQIVRVQVHRQQNVQRQAADVDRGR